MNSMMKRVVGVAGDRFGRFIKRYRVLYAPAGWVSRTVASSPRSSFIGFTLGPLRARLRGNMSATDVLWVLDALAAESLRFSLAGGWGVDALIGIQNRDHDDLDVVIDDYEHNQPKARQALVKLGFKFVASQTRRTWMPDLATYDDGAGHRVELVSVDWDRLANALDSALDSPGSTSRDDLTKEVFAEGKINGVVVPCLSSRVQLLYHTRYPLKETLQHDVELLQSVFGPHHS
jgi:lincosamide nucleotidyltransferase A/C/D/E